MSTTTRFICQAYGREERGKGKAFRSVLVKTTAVECKSAPEAEERARKMFDRGSHAGIDAFSVEIDIELGDYSDPNFLVRLGDVPPLEA